MIDKKDLHKYANEFSWLKASDIKKIIKKNSMGGKIETGIRYWIAQFWIMPYNHKLDIPYLCSYLMSLADYIENVCCYAMEDSQVKLNKKIDVISNELFKYHKTFLTK